MISARWWRAGSSCTRSTNARWRSSADSPPPGIQINREADARNATISLRGLPGTFARTTLNGNGFANPVLNGSTPLGAFNSDIFQRPSYAVPELTGMPVAEAQNLIAPYEWKVDVQSERSDETLRARTQSILDRSNPDYLRAVPG